MDTDARNTTTGTGRIGQAAVALLAAIGTTMYRAALARAALAGISPEAIRATLDALIAVLAAAARATGAARAYLLGTARAAAVATVLVAVVSLGARPGIR